MAGPIVFGMQISLSTQVPPKVSPLNGPLRNISPGLIFRILKYLNFWLKLNRRNARIHKTHCSIDVNYFLRSICKKKKHLFTKTCREIGQSFEEKEVRLLRTWKYFKWQITQLLNLSYVIWSKELCWSRRLLITLFSVCLHISSYHTKPHLIIIF